MEEGLAHMVDFLERGVLRFKRDGFRKKRALFRKLADSQSPRVLFITCADSRVVPALITQTRPGDLFIARNPSNIVPVYRRDADGASAGIEYAVDILKVEQIVVCGHSDCGAVEGILHPKKVAGMPAVKRWLTCGKRSRQMLTRDARAAQPDAARLGVPHTRWGDSAAAPPHRRIPALVLSGEA
jgi:carbonic anhydrase